jgi:hypothetical protein
MFLGLVGEAPEFEGQPNARENRGKSNMFDSDKMETPPC